MIHPQDLVYFLNRELNILETFISHYVISGHLVGGLLMMVGLLTRLGALIQMQFCAGHWDLFTQSSFHRESKF